MEINKKHIIKYIIQFICVSISTYLLSPCDIKYKFSIIIGLISSSIFAILDYSYPIVITNQNSPS